MTRRRTTESLTSAAIDPDLSCLHLRAMTGPTRGAPGITQNLTTTNEGLCCAGMLSIVLSSTRPRAMIGKSCHNGAAVMRLFRISNVLLSLQRSAVQCFCIDRLAASGNDQFTLENIFFHARVGLFGDSEFSVCGWHARA